MKAEPTAHPHAREVRHNFSLNRTTMPRFSNWNAALSEIASWLLSTLAARSARAAALRRTARLCLFVRNYCNDDAAWEDVSPKRMAVRVYFSTDGLPPRDRVKFWRDYFARQVHSFTPARFRMSPASAPRPANRSPAELRCWIETGLEPATRADVQRDKTEAIYIRRFRAPMIWRAASATLG